MELTNRSKAERRKIRTVIHRRMRLREDTSEGTTVVGVYVDGLIGTDTSDAILDTFGAAMQSLE